MPTSFTESDAVEQMIFDAATSLGSGAGGFFRPRMTRITTDGIQSKSFLSVPIREIRGSGSFQFMIKSAAIQLPFDNEAYRNGEKLAPLVREIGWSDRNGGHA